VDTSEGFASEPVALIAGTKKGIGLQIAKHLEVRGFTVLVGSRNLEKGVTAAKSVGNDARAPSSLTLRIRHRFAPAAERIVEEFGRLDVLVNNAGILHVDKPGWTFEEVALLVRAER
jgi:NAD(P)-dependent dehydrogenase (short-subunit alcohol dehydrogenase family)